MILVSACLLNHPVRYKGDGNPCQLLLEAVAKGHGEELVPFCPEVALGHLITFFFFLLSFEGHTCGIWRFPD